MERPTLMLPLRWAAFYADCEHEVMRGCGGGGGVLSHELSVVLFDVLLAPTRHDAGTSGHVRAACVHHI